MFYLTFKTTEFTNSFKSLLNSYFLFLNIGDGYFFLLFSYLEMSAKGMLQRQIGVRLVLLLTNRFSSSPSNSDVTGRTTDRTSLTKYATKDKKKLCIRIYTLEIKVVL